MRQAVLCLCVLGSTLVSSALRAEPRTQRWVLPPSVKANHETEAIRQLMSILDHPDASQRVQAAIVLGRKGSKANSAIPCLTDKLTDQQSPLRFAAEWAIVQIALSIDRDPSSISPVERGACLEQLNLAVAALEGNKSSSRNIAVILRAKHRLQSNEHPVFATRSRRALPIVPALVLPGSNRDAQRLIELRQVLHAQDHVAMIAAIESLRKLGLSAAPVLAAALDDEQADPTSLWYIENMLASFGEGVVPTLLPRLSSNNEVHRETALRILELLDGAAKQAVPALVKILRDDRNTEQRRSAARTLKSIGTGARDAAPILAGIFVGKDEDSMLRHDAIEALGQTGVVNDATRDAMIQVLRSETCEVSIRTAAANWLVTQHLSPAAVYPILKELLMARSDDAKASNDTTNWTQLTELSSVVELLGSLGKDASDCVPQLAELLHHTDSRIRAAAVQALARIGSKSVMPQVVRCIQSETSLDSQREMVKTVVDFGPQAIEELCSGLKSTDIEIQGQTLQALYFLGSPASPAVPVIIEFLADSASPDRRRAAAEALYSIGASACAAVEPLCQLVMTSGEELEIRIACVRALSQIGPDAQGGVSSLLKMVLDDEVDGQLRAESVMALGKIRPEATSEVHAGLYDRDARVQAAVASLLTTKQSAHYRAVPVLIQSLTNQEAGEFAASTLVNLGSSAIPFLEAVVWDPDADEDLRLQAVHVLGLIGDAAIPALVKAISFEEAIAEAATCELDMIGQAAVPALLQAMQQHQLTNNRDDPRHAEIAQRYRQPIEMMFEDGRGSGDAALGAPEFGSSGGAAAVGSMARAQGAVSPAAESASMADESSGLDTTRSNLIMASPTPSVPIKTVKVFYATNRLAIENSHARWHLGLIAFLPAICAAIVTLLVCLFLLVASRKIAAAAVAVCGLLIAVAFAVPAMTRTIQIERAANRPGPAFGVESSKILSMGACDVSIPATHKFGELESTSFFHAEIQQDPTRHIMVQTVTPFTRDQFYVDLKRDLAARGNSILVFVHGYNVDFDDAARRTAQMAHDLEFAGAPVFFSWPSQGNWHQYRVDEQQVAIAVDSLKPFLLDIVRTAGAESIHLVAHSMGTRALTAALREIELETKDRGTPFHQVVLAAPDIDSEIFRKQIAPAMRGAARQVTLYASSNDLALVASRTFNNGTSRVGDTSRGVFVTPGIETIDVSNVDSSLLGHCYYGSNPTVLTDLKELLRSKHAADQRPYLRPIASSGTRYWTFSDSSTARGVTSLQTR